MQERGMALSELAEILRGIGQQSKLAAEAIDRIVQEPQPSVDAATFMREGRKEVAALVRSIEGPQPRRGGRKEKA